MKRLTLAFSLLWMVAFAQAQVQTKLDNAVRLLLADDQMKHAIAGFYVVESNSGKAIYALNEEVGLAPASTQKVFTSIATLDMLGEQYTYKTLIGYDGRVEGHILNGNLIIKGGGDPTLGSWRYLSTRRAVVLEKIYNALFKAGITSVKGDIIFDASRFSYQPLPGGWIWDDIGNYYGAGTWGINWNENQYDLNLKPGNKEGDDVEIISTTPELKTSALTNFLKTGKQGSGDNGYIYLPPYSSAGFVNGTVPAGEKQFKISGAFPNPSYQLGQELSSFLSQKKISVVGKTRTTEELINSRKEIPACRNIIDSISSPSMDSIIYFFLQKSINLYGEALIKTLAAEKYGVGSTEKGVELLQQYWYTKSIDNGALNIVDGSGLSPQNRVTVKAMVTALQYARDKKWFKSFYAGIPVYNDIKMKSGSIGGARAFTGYIVSKSGQQYTFAIIVNNYNGSSSAVVKKIYKVLDELKGITNP